MAFHSYPHLIRKLFNAYRCGPPSGVTRTSSWTRVDHSVSRLPRPTCALLRLAFATAAGVVPLNLAGHGNSQVHYAKGTPSHLRAPTACRRTVSGSFSLPCSGCFSPFPHGTGSLSVSREYLALPDGPGGFTRDSSCPALLRTPLLGESLLFSFPAGTKMFQFPAFASAQLRGCHPFRMTGCPIRRPADRGLLAPPRGFSQLAASFIASGSLGIHRAPLSTSFA